MCKYIFETEKLNFYYGDGTHALKDISCKIGKGKKIAFLGSNGSGKSTLFLNLNGVLKPKNGKILFKDKEIKYSSSELIELRKKVGVVFQDPDSQLFSASVYQDVSFGPMNLRLSKDEVERRVSNSLKITETEDLKYKATHFLSHGQKKRVTIADILAMEPEAIIFDEPTDSLDPKHTEKTFELFDKLNKSGTTIIISTHDIDKAYSWADYIFIMKDGVIIGEGLPEKIFDDILLLNKADLLRPMILELYDALINNRYISNTGDKPKNKEELLILLSQNQKID